MVSNPYQNYIKQEVEGATKGKLVLLLYDGCIKFMKTACMAIEEQNIQGAHTNIMKAENIIYELMATLNMEAGEISENLMRLYDFMIFQLVQANKDKSIEKIESVVNLMSTLREAWKEVVNKEEGVAKQEAEHKSINFAG